MLRESESSKMDRVEDLLKNGYPCYTTQIGISHIILLDKDDYMGLLFRQVGWGIRMNVYVNCAKSIWRKDSMHSN